MLKTKIDHTFPACVVTGNTAGNLPLLNIISWGHILQGPFLKNFHSQHTVKTTGQWIISIATAAKLLL